MLMITSDNVPVAIAGVMGGDASKIDDTTTSLLLESATFDGVSVRKTTTRLGLRTDASMRYEKMLDPELCRVATERLLKLLFDLDSGATVISAFTDDYVKHYPTITLTFDKKYVDRYTGIEISDENILTTLKGLGFKVSLENGIFTVTVPSWRATKDVTIKADIIEEITRIYGYDNFKISTSDSPLLPVRKEIRKSEEDRMKDILVKSYRMHEVHSYIWSDAAKDKELGIKTPDNVKIINAQTPDHQSLRISMIPTLLAFAKENRGFDDEFAIFEIGHTVNGLREDGTCKEENRLGAVIYSKVRSEEDVFTTLADAARELCADILHKDAEFKAVEAEFDFEHPVNTFGVFADGVRIGTLSVPHPTVLSNIDKKCAVSFLEIGTEQFASVLAGKNSYVQPSKFPAIDIDLTFVADVSAVDFTLISDKAREAAGASLADVKAKDIYTGEDGSTALTLRFSFVSYDKTLSKQELAPAIDAIVSTMGEMGMPMKA